METVALCGSLGTERWELIHAGTWFGVCLPCLRPWGSVSSRLVGETGMAVVITVCGSSKSRGRMRWLRRGKQLLGRTPWDEWSGEEAEAKLGFEGQIRVCQVNEGRWPGKKRLEQQDGACGGDDHVSFPERVPLFLSFRSRPRGHAGRKGAPSSREGSQQRDLPRSPLGPQPEVCLPYHGSRAASRPSRVVTPVSFLCKNEYSAYTLVYDHKRRLFAFLALDSTEIVCLLKCLLPLATCRPCACC